MEGHDDISDVKIDSKSTQTEWSWLEDLASRDKSNDTIFVKHLSSNNTASSSMLETESNLDNDDNTEEDFPPESESEKEEQRLRVPLLTTDDTESQHIAEISLHNAKFNHVSKQDDVKPATAPIPDNSHTVGVGDNYYSDSDTDTFSTEDSDDEVELRFPAVGPPQMLQHIRESVEGLPESIEKDKSSIEKSLTGLQKSFFSGPCQFCGQSVLPLPTVKEVQKLSNKQLYCCYEYEDFIKLYITYNEKKTSTSEIIDITPHAPYGTKAARKAAKERAAERMREKELERQKAVTAQANFFSFNRQVKTVQYALSSIKCMEEGWTIRPQTPIDKPVAKEIDLFSIEVNSTLLQEKKELYQRYYENGNKFLLIHPDGTGCCYYPSGNVAVMIVSPEKGKYIYILQKDSDDYDTDDTGILAIFEPNGNASCFYKDGSLRLLLTSYYGAQMDKSGNYKKRWQWHFIRGHVHAPPFQPICFSLNKELSCRVMEQDNIIVSFTSGQRAVRFNAGAKLKAFKLTVPPITRDEHSKFIESTQKKVQGLTEKIKLTMRFPKSPKLEALVSRSQTPSPRKKLSSHTELKLPKLKQREPSVVVN
eukprot:gene11401-12588_t